MTETLRIVSPVDDRVYWEGAYAEDDVVDTLAAAARGAAPSWRRMDVGARVRALETFLDHLRRDRETLREMLAWQIGRPMAQADEFGRLEAAFSLYRGSLRSEVQDVVFPSNWMERRWLRREPFGVALSICAWNYPVAMLAPQIFAPLLAGNVVIFKHAPQAARISEVLRRAAEAAGLPHGVFQAADLTNAQSARLLGSGAVDFVTFIGSTRGGREVRQAMAGHFATAVFELGGKDPAFVRADADLAFAARELVPACFSNSGQSCCSVERIYVDARVANRFIEAFAEEARRLRVGNPITSDAALGPVVSGEAARRIEAEIGASVRAGARDVLGYARADLPEGRAYVAPVVLTGVSDEMAVMRDETFGPVAAIATVGSDAEAVARMNRSAYGLTASIWTADIDRGVALAAEVEAGNVYLNRADYVDDHLPWGGVKQSGLGRSDGPRWWESVTEPKGIYARIPA